MRILNTFYVTNALYGNGLQEDTSGLKEDVMTYLEFTGEDKSRGVADSSKFWQVDQQSKTLIIVFGKIGTNGQTTHKEYATEADAKKEMDKLIQSKTKKGYVEKKK